MKEFINHLLNKQCIFRIIMLFFSEDKQERIIIYKFRYGLAFFGHDISNMTDQEIKEEIVKSGKIISKIGFTMKEITELLNKNYKL